MTNYGELAKIVKQYPPERAAQICGIDAATIREVARLWGEAGAGVIYWGMGISQHTTGTDNSRCLIAMCSITGHVGRPGTGLHPLRGQNNVQGASDAGLIPMMFPDYQRVDNAAAHEKFEDAWGRPLDAKPGLTVTEIVGSALKGGVRGMYMMGENPFLSDPNINKVRKALAALEFLVVQDIFLTETAEFADVVLPGHLVPGEGRDLHEHRPARADRPQGARPARRGTPGLGDHPRDLGPDRAADGVRVRQRGVRRDGRALARLRRAGVRQPRAGGQALSRTRTPSTPTAPSCCSASRSRPTTARRTSCPPSGCRPRSCPSEEYPFVLNTGRLLEHWHTGSMTRRSFALDAIQPTAMVFMSEADAARMGIADGDFVRVSSRRGSIELAAKVSHRETPGSCFIPFHFREAAANLLTIDEIDPFGKIPEFKFCAVKIETTDREPIELPDSEQALQGAG